MKIIKIKINMLKYFTILLFSLALTNCYCQEIKLRSDFNQKMDSLIDIAKPFNNVKKTDSIQIDTQQIFNKNKETTDSLLKKHSLPPPESLHRKTKESKTGYSWILIGIGIFVGLLVLYFIFNLGLVIILSIKKLFHSIKGLLKINNP